MRYLRMLSNSMLVGFVAGLYIALLFVLLNPQVPLTFGATMPVLGVVLLSYGLHIGVLTYVLYVGRQLMVLEQRTPAWVSLRILAWSSGIAGLAVGPLLWLNALGYRTALGEPAAQSLVADAAILAAAGVLLLALALTRTLVQRGRFVVGTLYAAIVLVSIGGPLFLRDRGYVRLPMATAAPAAGGEALRDDAPRVIALLLDGASLGVISPAVAAGRLPNFGRLLDGGVSMHLATTRPTQPEPVWSSVMTGKWPARHGIRGAAVYRPFAGGPALEVLPDLLFTQALVRFGFLEEEPHSSATIRATPLWRILSRNGVSAGVIGLPLTRPPEPLRGFMVSADDAALEAVRQGRVVPPAMRARMELLPVTGESGSNVLADQVHHDLALRLGASGHVRVLVVRYAGLDAVAHYYLRFAMPEAFGDVSGQERQRFGRVLEDYYGYVDGLIGEALGSLRDRDLLLVVSGFGMEPLTPGKRLLERIAGNEQFSGTHERAPDGFLLAYGQSVARGRRAPRGAVVDVTPTILYFLDEPVGRDMDGFARTDVFIDAFNAQRTITFIPTYDR
jgi:hypothetical protein